MVIRKLRSAQDVVPCNTVEAALVMVSLLLDDFSLIFGVFEFSRLFMDLELAPAMLPGEGCRYARRQQHEIPRSARTDVQTTRSPKVHGRGIDNRCFSNFYRVRR